MSETITTPHVDTPGGERKSGRLAALDAARGLAVIGMYVQHFALNERNSFVSGNTMILFILCSGISYSIMVRRMNEKGTEPSAFRARMLARAVFIDMAGYLLIMLNGPFAVVLPAYAMLFLLALLLIRSSARTLTAVSCVSFLVCPPLMLIGLSLFSDAALLYDLAGGPLSALAWLPVFTAGMALGRMELRSTRTAVRLVLGGAALLIPCKLFDIFLLPGIRQGFEAWLMRMPVNYQIDEYAIWPRNAQPVPVSYTHLDVYKRQVYSKGAIPIYTWTVSTAFADAEELVVETKFLQTCFWTKLIFSETKDGKYKVQVYKERLHEDNPYIYLEAELVKTEKWTG